ncbi:SEC-C motif-containing protein [Paramicrobacterium humi]|uniref:UPF0225 protein SAMN04489806_2762 n=1 Tax=Paramicrobacterium humi TaxID=640635 RepID=A0A1H4QAQ3_9MICO|nr:YchJ family metal-binding protein [Microbacterium humi]SEC16629.1 SEC-C motif-containing protein [Microbacterium humi]
MITADDPCPCRSGDQFGDCCAPLLAGSPAPTAERLMRSRYTAFAVGDREHLLRSWHPSTRPAELTLDAELRWVRLDVLSTRAGGPFDDEGTVHFIAHYRTPDGRGRQEEVSRFVRERKTWFYLDGVPAAS